MIIDARRGADGDPITYVCDDKKCGSAIAFKDTCESETARSWLLHAGWTIELFEDYTGHISVMDGLERATFDHHYCPIHGSAKQKGDWMPTVSGRRFWPLDPKPESIFIEDIAHALGNQCRYAGHTREFYSTAQHSVIVCDNLPGEYRLWGLLHDAPEAYLYDMIRPVKRYIPQYQWFEDRIMRAIATRFNLSWPMPDIVKEVDDRILHDERFQVMTQPQHEWNLRGSPLGVRIEPVPPYLARERFLRRFFELTNYGT